MADPVTGWGGGEMVAKLGLIVEVGYSMPQNRFVLPQGAFIPIQETELCNNQTNKFIIANCDYCYEVKVKGPQSEKASLRKRPRPGG